MSQICVIIMMSSREIMFMKFRYSFCTIFCLLVLAVGMAQAQKVKLQNRPYMDLRKFHYGFMVGLHTESLHMKNNGLVDPETGKQWLACNDQFDPNFTVGILGEWRLDKYFALRLLPTMHFGNKHITFRDQTTGEELHQDLKSTYISVPLDFKFSAPRFNNYRPYLVGGLNVMYDLTTKSNDYLKLKKLNTFLEVGFGCDYYLPFFKFIPELKFCFGLNNVLEKNRKDLQDKTKEIFSKSIDSANTNMIILTLYFE
jgi:hypothetical protein